MMRGSAADRNHDGGKTRPEGVSADRLARHGRCAAGARRARRLASRNIHPLELARAGVAPPARLIAAAGGYPRENPRAGVRRASAN
jgi:hypothetical protein